MINYFFFILISFFDSIDLVYIVCVVVFFCGCLGCDNGFGIDDMCKWLVFLIGSFIG